MMITMVWLSVFILCYFWDFTFIYADELEDGAARNPMQVNKKGFEEVSVEDGGIELKHGGTLTNPPAYGDSDNLF